MVKRRRSGFPNSGQNTMERQRVNGGILQRRPTIRERVWWIVVLLGAVGWACPSRAAPPPRPNVILIMTDDQGYGDMSCHGNKILQTPQLDRLHDQSIRLTNFHVDPTCSPTRAALMTGRYSSRTGVWHTIMGRSLLRQDETTMAEVFAANGYRTGIFGKWHLGDNYPCRPQDRGFQEVLVHGGGGVGQTPDFWGTIILTTPISTTGKPKPSKGIAQTSFLPLHSGLSRRTKTDPVPFSAIFRPTFRTRPTGFTRNTAPGSWARVSPGNFTE